MNNPLISIIIPVYNVESYLGRCINSLLFQAFTNFELLLIDDGSTDQSGKICDEYSLNDKRVRVFHQTNRGVSNARNIGLSVARGKWLSFVDSDDFVEPDYFDVIISSLHSHTSVDLVFWGAKHLYDSGDVTSYSPHKIYCTKRDDIENEILHLKQNPQKYEFFGYTWNKCFNADIIKKYHIAFINNLSIREDEIFTMDYCRYVNNLIVIPNCIYNYRVRNGGLTHQMSDSQEYLLLSEAISNNIPTLSSRDLITLEYQHVLYFLVWASILSKSYKERKKNVLMIMKTYQTCRQKKIILPFKIKVLFKIPSILYLHAELVLLSFFYRIWKQ